MNHQRLVPFIKEAQTLIRIATPITLAMTLDVANGLIDTIMLGQYNTLDLASGAMGASLRLFITLGCIGIFMSLTPLVAELKGSQQSQRIAFIFQQGVWIALPLSVIVLLLLQNSDYILRYVSTDTQLITDAQAYLNIISWSMPFTILYLVMRFVNEGVEYTLPMMVVQMIALPVNILGNYLLIFGNLGFPELGVSGAAIASAITYSLSCLLLYLNNILNKEHLKLHLFKEFSLPKLSQIFVILKLGIPIALSILMEAGLFTCIALNMATLGALQIAAHQIAYSYISLVYMIPLGLSIAATIRVGHAKGLNRADEIHKRGITAIIVVTVIMAASCLVLITFNQHIARIYSDDFAVVALASQLLLLGGIFQLSDGLQITAAGALRGMQITMLPMLINFVGYWIVALPISLYFSFKLLYGAPGLWYGLIIGLTVSAIMLTIILFKKLKQSE